MNLTSDDATIIILVGIAVLGLIAILAPASLGILLKALESLVDTLTKKEKP